MKRAIFDITWVYSPHSDGGMHVESCQSITVPSGHWQRGTHCKVQVGEGFLQVGGQADPQPKYT